MELTSGHILAQRYEIKGLIGQGGMGTVYLGYDPVLDRTVAIKQLPLDPFTGERPAEQLRRQFLREAQALANLNHPNLPRVTDFFEFDDLHYLVMDYIEGTSLQDVLRETDHGLDQERVLNWADQLLSALEYIHARNLIHRDIKPANIRLTDDGHVYLVDFGLVKHYDINNPKTLTMIHTLGTLEYAPPEQYDAAGHTDQRSDLYALGATLYHLLSGQAPVAVSRRIAEPSAYQPLQKHMPNVSPELANAIGRAMEMEREKRFASAADMRAALRLARQRILAGTAGTINLAEQSPVAAPIAIAPQPRQRSRRRVLLAGLLATAALAAITLAFANRPGNVSNGNLQNSVGSDGRGTATVTPSLTPTITLTAATAVTPPGMLTATLFSTPPLVTVTARTKPTSGGQSQPTLQPTRQPPGQANRPTPKPTNSNKGGGGTKNPPNNPNSKK